MTKKDFQLIAAVLAGATTLNPQEQAFKDALVHDFVKALQVTNPKFKRELFIQAATGQVAPTARKARPAGFRTTPDRESDTEAWERAMREHNAPGASNWPTSTRARRS